MIFMCIIIVKESGINPPDMELIRRCWDTNPHGAGIMYCMNNKVYIEKGFMKIENLLKKLKELYQVIDVINTPIVYHFRIKTSGKKDALRTHPFPVSDEDSKLNALQLTTNLGLVHNGVIKRYNHLSDTPLNDTQLFIKNELYNLYKLNWQFYKKVEGEILINNIIDNSRIAILNHEGKIYRYGEWIYDIETNLYFSNLCFKNKPSRIKDFDYIFNLEEKYYINSKRVNEEKFYQFIDCLDKLEDNQVVVDELENNLYYGSDDYYLVDTIDEVLYIMTDDNSIDYVCKYKYFI